MNFKDHWCACTVEGVDDDYVIVSFDGWDAELSCRVCDPREITLANRPVDVNVRNEVFKDARDLCFTNGVVFVAERGSSAIRFIELKSEVLLKPEHLKSRADLLSQLSRIGLSLEGTGPVLRKRLTTHLRSLAAQVENKEIVQINPPLSKLTSI